MENKANVISVSIPNIDTINHLQKYNEFLKTIFIKNLKSLTTFGGYSNIVCTNALKHIDLSDEICKLINSVIIKLQGFSVYSGIVTSSLILNLWSESVYEYGVHKISNALMELHNILETSMESMKIESESINAKFLQSLIFPLLLEEPAIYLDKDALHDLSLQIVKAVLSIADSDLRLGHINIRIEQGENEFFVLKGVICDVDDFCFRQVLSTSFDQLGSPKTVLFSESLDICENLPVLVEEIVKNDGVLVICQKKVSDMAKLMLRRAGLITIERVGEETMKALEQLISAVPVRDFSNNLILDLPGAMGRITDMKTIKKSNKNLVSITSYESPVSTLYIQCRTFADSSLIKEVINCSIRLIRSILFCPSFLPGPISFEKSLVRHLKTHCENTSFLNKIIGIFVNILEDISSLYCKSVSKDFDHLDSYYLKRNAMLLSLNTTMSVLSLGCIVRKN